MGRVSENPPRGHSLEGRHIGVRLTEEQKMRSILSEYEPRLGSFEMVPVGDAGWALQRRPVLPYPRIVVTSDVDDTLIATNQLKRLRTNLVGDFLKQRGREMPDDAVRELMDTSYKHAQQVLGGGKYNMDNHALVLAYKIGHPGADVLPNDLEAEIDPNVLTACRNIFQETLHMIPQYSHTVAALEELGRQKGQEQMAINLFTYGTPPEQLVKSLDVLKNPDLHEAIDQILITQVPKDEFMRTAIETGSLQDLARRYQGDQERGDEYVFGQYPHVIVGLDDSIQSVNSQSKIASTLQKQTGAELTLVRVRQKGAKDAAMDWDERGEHVEIDLRGDQMTGEQLAASVLKIANQRFEERFGRATQQFPAAA